MALSAARKKKISNHPLRLIKSAMLLWQNDNNSQWMIVVFYPSSCVSQTYLPLYLDKDRGQYIIQTWYPNAITSVWVPTTMNAVISALKNKQVGCRFCHQLILNEAGAIALRDGFQGRFSSVDEANDYFIQVIIEGYLVIALHGFRNNKRKLAKLKRKVPAAKRRWNKSRDDRRQKEAYLGSKSFPYELSRCCREFYHFLKKEWGFTPEKVLLMN
jgi:hypothetical protein